MPLCAMYVFPHLPIADIATLRIYAGIILQKERQANTGAVRDALAGITDYYGMGDGAIPAGNPQTQQLGRTLDCYGDVAFSDIPPQE